MLMYKKKDYISSELVDTIKVYREYVLKWSNPHNKIEKKQKLWNKMCDVAINKLNYLISELNARH